MHKVIPLCLAACLSMAASLGKAQDRPELTGVWMAPFQVHSSGIPMMSGVTPWVPVSYGDVHDYKLLTLEQMSAIADISVKEHHGNPTFGRAPNPPLPFTAAGKAAADRIDPKAAEKRELACYPNNMIDRVGGGPIQIVQNPRAIAIQSEGGTPGRIIFTDGRDQANAIPQWNGLSVGRWNGATLKVTTVAIRGEVFGMGRLPMDENVKLTEDYTLSQDGRVLTILATLEDPTIFSEPLRKLIHLNRTTDVMVTDYTCTEGKEDMIETLVPPKPVEPGAPGVPPV